MAFYPAPESLDINEFARLNSQLLPRLQLLEFHECSWFPQSLKNAITEVLRAMCFQLRVHDVILPAENKTNVDEDLTPEQLENLNVHYVKTISEVLELALPTSRREKQHDAEEREKVLAEQPVS